MRMHTMYIYRYSIIFKDVKQYTGFNSITDLRVTKNIIIGIETRAMFHFLL